MSNSRKMRRSVTATRPVRRDDPETFWNGEPTPARRVRVVVAEPPANMPHHWLHGAGLIGQTVDAVEVTYPAWDGPMYLYDGDGSGWFKVTEGRGSPRWGHKNLPVEFGGAVDMPRACGYCRGMPGHAPGCHFKEASGG